MIRALDPKLNPATAEIQVLKNQLGERDKQIVTLEVSLYFHAFSLFSLLNASLSVVLQPQRQCEQARLREYEEKMIVTAWYNKVPRL